MPETTDTLKWTQRPHALLRDIAADKMEIYHGLVRSLVQTEATPRDFLRGHEARTVVYLRDAIMWGFAGMGRCTPARLTTLGVALLHRWDVEHPEGGERCADQP